MLFKSKPFAAKSVKKHFQRLFFYLRTYTRIYCKKLRRHPFYSYAESVVAMIRHEYGTADAKSCCLRVLLFYVFLLQLLLILLLYRYRTIDVGDIAMCDVFVGMLDYLLML